MDELDISCRNAIRCRPDLRLQLVDVYAEAKRVYTNTGDYNAICEALDAFNEATESEDE